jgi:hypothetical protein
MVRHQVADGGDGLQIRRVGENILNNHSRSADRMPPDLPATKSLFVTKRLIEPRTWTNSLARSKHRKMDRRLFGA